MAVLLERVQVELQQPHQFKATLAVLLEVVILAVAVVAVQELPQVFLEVQ